MPKHPESCVFFAPFQTHSGTAWNQLAEFAASHGLTLDQIHFFHSSECREPPSTLQQFMNLADFVVIDLSEIMPLAMWAKGYCDALSIRTVLISNCSLIEVPSGIALSEVFVYDDSTSGDTALSTILERTLGKNFPGVTPNGSERSDLRTAPWSGQMPD